MDVRRFLSPKTLCLHCIDVLLYWCIVMKLWYWCIDVCMFSYINTSIHQYHNFIAENRWFSQFAQFLPRQRNSYINTSIPQLHTWKSLFCRLAWFLWGQMGTPSTFVPWNFRWCFIWAWFLWCQTHFGLSGTRQGQYVLPFSSRNP